MPISDLNSSQADTEIQTEAEKLRKEVGRVGLLIFLSGYILSLCLLDKKSTSWGAENDFTRESKQQCESV